MRAARVILICAPLLAGPAASPPSFAGRWTLLVRPAGEIPVFCRLDCVITQDENTLTAREPAGDLIETFRLDGTPDRRKFESVGQPVEQSVRAHWERDALLIDSTLSFPKTGDSRITHLRMFLQGGRLIFERRMGDNAMESRRGGAGPVRLEYARKQ